MRQIRTYKVDQQGFRNAGMLDGNDALLVDTYTLGISSFNPDESRLDVIVRDENDNVLETFQDISEYKILGVEQGPHKVNQLVVDPTIYLQDRTYLGNIVVEYQAFNNLYAKGAELFVFDISADRTEVRAKSLVVSNSDLRYFTQTLQNRLNNESYFSEAYLEVQDQKFAIINATTEVVNGALVATFKLYKPLPESVTLRTPFQVLESLGESNQFLVREEVSVVEDPPVELRGPNFGVKVYTATHSTPYRNYLELLSQKSWECSKELYSSFRRASQHVSVDYSDFSQFIHFSSAFERLENARYKFELIFEYRNGIENAKAQGNEDEAAKLQGLVDGIIENFDHYENFLYFENDPAAWPKKRESYPDGPVIRPYELEDDVQTYEAWYEEIIAKAEAYDLHNKDLLINTIPVAIREDVDNNEPYIMFVHMIGQHFDDLWIYARAITDRYKADNRANFGISKELVKDAIENFGLDLYETDQNLNALFELIRPDGTYSTGSDETGSFNEKAVKAVNTPTGSWRTQEQEWSSNYLGTGSVDIPSSWTAESGSWTGIPRIETYTKEVYKRIYHNIPALVKMKGTSRGLRVLLNCFGIPDSILKIRVQGGTDPEHKPFFGPEEWISLSETGSFHDLDKIDSKVRITGSTPVSFEEYNYEDRTGSFYTSSVLSRYVPTTASTVALTDDSHKVEIGFDLNEAVNHYFTTHVTESFTVDDVIGDPRNKEEHYGDVWKPLREQILTELQSTGNTFRSPAALIRFVRYFDTTFFRMLQDFIPARASIDSAVIVKDNILHRNRWKGVEADLEELSISGSAGRSTITGSHGGVYNYVGERFNTGDKKTYINPGTGKQIKSIPSGSREFNGELQGTEFSTLTGGGDLSQYNEHRKDLQPENRFDYTIWFLDLPDPPLCGVGASVKDTLGLYSVRALGAEGLVDVAGTTATVGSNAKYFWVGDNSIGTVKDSHWSSVGSATKIFVGTTSSFSTSSQYTTSLLGKLNPSTKFNFSNVDYTRNNVAVVYVVPSSSNTFWVQINHPTGSAQYYVQDLMISWKYLPTGQNPKTTGTGVNPWRNPGDITVDVTLKSGATRSISLPAIETFGTEDGYYWAGTSSVNVDYEKPYGLRSLAGNKSPFLQGTTLIDGTWFSNYEDWWTYFSTHRWVVNSGSAKPHGDDEHWMNS